MGAIFAFRCQSCGQVHEGAPSFGYPAPMYYSQLPEPERGSRARLTSDTCVIDNEDRFVRVCLEVPIHGIQDPFLWGVWVSLSEKSFERYLATWEQPDESDRYFGWFSNRLPYYPDTTNLKTNVRPQKGGSRPLLELQETDHPLYIDWRDGITVERAQEIAEACIHLG